MASEPEFLITNLIDAATMTESSEESSLPSENVQNPFRTKKWRSDSGWNIITGFNDAIDFEDGGGEENVALDPGNYATAALMGTEIKTQMETATGDTITVSYTARKFTIETDGGQLDLLWDSGTNTATSCGEDLGYDTSADDEGTSHEADDESRCSREWIGIALSAATQAKRCAIVSHNFSSAAVVTLYRHTSDDLSAATAIDTITYDADFMVLEFDATYKHWWIHVDDIDNSNSYIEIGRAFLGDFSIVEYVELGMEFVLIDPSVPTTTPEGYIGRNERDQFKQVRFSFAELSETDRDNLISIYETIGAFDPFFFIPDPAKAIFTQADLGGMYGYFLTPEVPISVISGATTWKQGGGLVFEEAR